MRRKADYIDWKSKGMKKRIIFAVAHLTLNVSSSKMSTLTGLSVILMATAILTMSEAGRLDRIENNIKNVETNVKNIDLILHAYSNDIFKLKNDVADTNTKLDILLELINGTTPAHHAYTNIDIDATTEDDVTSDYVSTINDLKATVQEEISRVRRAFGTEKERLTKRQQRYDNKFLQFVDTLEDKLAVLHDRHDTKWTLAADAINESVVTVLGAVRDDIDNQLVQWTQSIHDNLKEQTTTTLATLDTFQETVRLTKSFPTKLMASLTELNDSVRSMNYSNTLSNIANSMELHDDKVERLVYLLHTNHVMVRLENSASINKGRLEVYVDGQWGTVCDDSFTDTDASVVCKMLGYRSGTSIGEGYFGEGSLPIVMDDVQCVGTEYRIQDCSRGVGHDCSHSEDVGVICSQQDNFHVLVDYIQSHESNVDRELYKLSKFIREVFNLFINRK